MNEPKIFNCDGNQVRKRHDRGEVGRFEFPHPQSPDKTAEMVCVNESGLQYVG